MKMKMKMFRKKLPDYSGKETSDDFCNSRSPYPVYNGYDEKEVERLFVKTCFERGLPDAVLPLETYIYHEKQANKC